MVPARRRFRFYRNRRGWRSRRLGLSGCLGETFINFLKVGLQPFLDVSFQFGELNSHANAGIAGTHHGGSLNFLRIDPKGDHDIGTDLQRNHRLHVATPSADVGGAALHMCPVAVCETNFNRELDLVAGEDAPLPPPPCPPLIPARFPRAPFSPNILLLGETLPPPSYFWVPRPPP